jgi:glycolate oxidase FAD binding subunit
MTTVAAARRPASPDDALGGVVPREVVRPTSVEEVAEVLRAAHADGLTVVPVGAAPRPPGRRRRPPATCCSTRPASTASSSTSPATSSSSRRRACAWPTSELLGEHGQLLGLDPPEQGATLGGVVSANASGPRGWRTARCATCSSAPPSCSPTAPSPRRRQGRQERRRLRPRQALHRRPRHARGRRLDDLAAAPPPPGRAVVVVGPGRQRAGRTARGRPQPSTLTPSAVELVGTAGGPGGWSSSSSPSPSR